MLPYTSALYKLGLSSATDVFLTGCSAGGLATYLHAGMCTSKVGPRARVRSRITMAIRVGISLSLALSCRLQLIE